MSDWVEVTLGEVIKRRIDFTPVDPDVEYSILGVQRSGWGFVQRDPILGRDQKFTKLLRVERDDFVYRTITAFEAPSGVAGPAEDGLFVTPQTFPVFRVDRAAALPGYLGLLTTWPRFHHEMASRCSGTVLRRKTLSIGAFQAIPIPLPPLAEQRRLVDIMAAVDVQIEALRVEHVRAIESARRARLALLAVGVEGGWENELTDSHTSLRWTDSLPAGWRRETIGGAATVRSGGTPRRSEQAKFFENGSIAWVKTGDLNERKIHTTPESITEAGFASSSVRLLPADTVLVAMYGGFGQIGRTARLGVAATTNQAISALTELRDDVLPAYLHQALKAGRPKWRLVAASSRKDPNISKRDVENFDFPLPPLDEQSEIVSIIEGAEMSVDNLESELACLRMFRSVLLTSLLSQDIEIPEAYDSILKEDVA